MNFYIASSFANVEAVSVVGEKLNQLGYVQTYDWTLNGRASTIGQLQKIGAYERQAVLAADFVVVLLPAGKDSHIEMGIALGANKKVYLHSLTDAVMDVETTSTFYHLPEVEIVIGSLDDLVEAICTEKLGLEG
ncbi:group-specific protein [Planococcus sp. YIM B11945]|uniref:group-specific protein n=1 Tax=Planococcus sp. YIM B11945 TaxID=3435410 RepID=UPI003D7DF4E5